MNENAKNPTEPNTESKGKEICLIGRPTRDASDSLRKSNIFSGVLNMNDKEMERLKRLLGC